MSAYPFTKPHPLIPFKLLCFSVTSTMHGIASETYQLHNSILVCGGITALLMVGFPRTKNRSKESLRVSLGQSRVGGIRADLNLLARVRERNKE